jgi:hypothetical protein
MIAGTNALALLSYTLTAPNNPVSKTGLPTLLPNVIYKCPFDPEPGMAQVQARLIRYAIPIFA